MLMYMSTVFSDPFYFQKIYTSIIKIVMLFILFVKIKLIMLERIVHVHLK